MSAHTPGPWRVIETHLLPHDGDHVADMSNGLMVVASAKLGDPLADARLIATAPELLEALEWLADILPDPELDNDELQRVWTKKARAAIAKATGAKP